jgi:hypothetical protein
VKNAGSCPATAEDNGTESLFSSLTRYRQIKLSEFSLTLVKNFSVSMTGNQDRLAVNLYCGIRDDSSRVKFLRPCVIGIFRRAIDPSDPTRLRAMVIESGRDGSLT